MGQGEADTAGPAQKGVVVVVALLRPLGGQPGMAHDHPGAVWDHKAHPVGGQGPLVDPQGPAAVVGDPRGVGAPGLALRRQKSSQPGELPARETAAVIHNSKQAAHQYSTPASTGSFT